MKKCNNFCFKDSLLEKIEIEVCGEFRNETSEFKNDTIFYHKTFFLTLK